MIEKVQVSGHDLYMEYTKYQKESTNDILIKICALKSILKDRNSSYTFDVTDQFTTQVIKTFTEKE